MRRAMKQNQTGKIAIGPTSETKDSRVWDAASSVNPFD
jgi:hypothetical protein